MEKVQGAPLLLGLVLLVGMAMAVPKIDPEIYKSLQSKGTANVLVSFKNPNLDQVRKTFEKQYNSAKRPIRLAAFHRLFKAHADKTQTTLLASLNIAKKQEAKSSLQIEQLWVTNQLVLRGASKKIIALLETSQDVAKAENDRLIPMYGNNHVQSSTFGGTCDRWGPQWGIRTTEAPDVWRLGYKGEDVVVAITDTGVNHNHRALRDNFRVIWGWYNPLDRTTSPTDDNGHGTHVAGTIVGTKKGIGMAPDAKWIACRACHGVPIRCYEQLLLLCGQWTMCPDSGNQNCETAPRISANSWGTHDDSIRGYYEDVLKAYHAVGIVPVFAIGNSGQNTCGNSGYPGDSENAIGVGATDSRDQVDQESSAGPSRTFWFQNRQALIKPDVSAPGQDICSAAHDSNNGYVTMTGTSMACPHVAGLIALLLSRDNEMSNKRVYECIIKGTRHTRSSGRACGGTPDTTFPNNQAGFGRINALDSIRYCFPTLG